MAVSPDSRILGQRLARLRKERGITQVELAQALGVSQSNMSDYERGILRLHGELILAIVRILDVSSDELLGVTDSTDTAPDGPQRATKAKRVLTRLQKVEQLPKRDRDALMRTIDAFLAKAG